MTAVYIERARMLQELARHDEALDALASAARDDPTDATVQSLRAISLAGLSRFEEAVRVAREGLALAPSDPFGHFALAKVLILNGDMQGGRESILTALHIQPASPDCYALLAVTYQAEHQLTLALETVGKGLQLDPAHSGCLWLRAVLYDMQGRQSLAMSTIHDLLRMNPHFAPGLALYESLQRSAGVRDVPSLALRTDPRHRSVKSMAVAEILFRSVVFRWVVTSNRILMRFGRSFVAVVLATGLLLWIATALSSMLSPALNVIVRVALWIYSGLQFAFIFGWCIGDVYVRFHPTGRWLLSGNRRKGAEVVAAGFGVGALLAIVAVLMSSHHLAMVGAGIAAGGLCVSKSLPVVQRIASLSEFVGSVAFAAAVMVVLAAGLGRWSDAFAISVAATVVVAAVARVVGWPRLAP